MCVSMKKNGTGRSARKKEGCTHILFEVFLCSFLGHWVR